MKFLCPNCKAKYRIGPEKMAGRQAAKIRCRKCEYLIQIAYRGDGDEFDVTATPPSAAPPASTQSGRAATGSAGQSGGSMGPGAWARLPPIKEEGSASKKPTAAVPGLPGLGSARSTRGAALLSDPAGLQRRLAPLPPPPVPGATLGAVLAPPAPERPAPGTTSLGVGAVGVSAPAAASPSLRSASSTQLGDQFRESVQASGAAEDLPREGWFVGVNGVPVGPIPLGDLRELAAAGHVDRRSLVWREGQAEWRPLGKFPGLARVIDDGGPPPPSPRPEPPPPPSARTNGANGHLATGFDAPRPDLSERPSAWGDLEDDDDDDEQPTTIKGRVSVLPISGLQPTPPPPSSVAVQPSVSSPFGITASVVAAPAQSPVQSQQMPAVGLGGHYGIGAAQESGSELGERMGTGGRSRWYLVAVAIVFAFALGAIVTHLMRSSTSSETGATTPWPRTGQGSKGQTMAAGPEAPPGEAARGGADDAPGPPRGLAQRTDLQRTSGSFGTAGRAGSGAAVNAALTGTSGMRRGRASGPGLLTGVAPASALAPEPRTSTNRAGANGLDAAAVQSTVRRYTPGVRQSCWQSAREARAPGVPPSAKVTATITVAAAGHVEAVTVAGAPRGYPTLGRCIQGAVRRWKFPRAGGQTITNVPFMFVGK